MHVHPALTIHAPPQPHTQRHAVLPCVSLVRPKLWVGSAPAETCPVTEGVQAVLSLSPECAAISDSVLRDWGVHVYQRIEFWDDLDGQQDVQAILHETCRFVQFAQRQKYNTLVHCHAGQSRSVTAVLAWLIKSERIPLSTAYEQLVKIHPATSPNLAFMFELTKFQHSENIPDAVPALTEPDVAPENASAIPPDNTREPTPQ